MRLISRLILDSFLGIKVSRNWEWDKIENDPFHSEAHFFQKKVRLWLKVRLSTTVCGIALSSLFSSWAVASSFFSSFQNKTGTSSPTTACTTADSTTRWVRWPSSRTMRPEAGLGNIGWWMKGDKHSWPGSMKILVVWLAPWHEYLNSAKYFFKIVCNLKQWFNFKAPKEKQSFIGVVWTGRQWYVSVF